MKPRAFRLAALLPVAAFLVLASGCIRFQEELVVMPDGSGKVVFTLGFNLEIMDKFKEMMGGDKEMEEKTTFSAEDMENAEGIVAFTRPVMAKKDGWRTVTFTGYFEDINKVKIWDKDGEKKTLKASFSFRKEGEGHVLEIDDRFMASDDNKFEEVPDEGKDQAWAMIKEFLKGFEMSRGVRMPGPVTSVEGFASKEGRSAANKITADSLKNLEDVGKMMKVAKRKVACGKSDLSDADVAAFKKELEAAKAAWPKIKEEMKAEEEKKKKVEEK
jgi:hypothetical protein